jgi:hypothetical protein
MKKVVVLMLLFSVFAVDKSFAQYGRRYYPRYRRSPERNADPYFKPSVYLSIGYGFPNLDKNELLHFYNFYRGNTDQTGPIHASIDYQFNRSTSVGVMVAYAKASAPYFDYNSSSSAIPAFNGKLEDWSILFNMVRYIPAGRVVSPYLRTAIGVSLWDESYIDSSGAKVVNPEKPNMLAYQVSLGTKINFSNQSGIFIEAGYGKYIVSGGLTFKF